MQLISQWLSLTHIHDICSSEPWELLHARVFAVKHCIQWYFSYKLIGCSCQVSLFWLVAGCLPHGQLHLCTGRILNLPSLSLTEEPQHKKYLWNAKSCLTAVQFELATFWSMKCCLFAHARLQNIFIDDDLLQVLSKFLFICSEINYTPATKLGGYTGITVSVCLSVRTSVCRPHLGFRRISAFPLHLSSWNFTWRLPMSRGYALSILGSKGQGHSA